ncbi:hypothetical protein D3C77_561590 [compost metagenome]
MSRAYRIRSHFLQNDKSSTQSGFIESSSESAQIMMLTDPVQFHLIPIEKEAMFRIELDTSKSDMMRNGFNLFHKLLLLVSSLARHNCL